MVTSSYSNNHDPQIDIGEDSIVVDVEAKFTRVPVAKVLDASRERIAECDRATGHTLKVTERGIQCTRCEAEWTEDLYAR